MRAKKNVEISTYKISPPVRNSPRSRRFSKLTRLPSTLCEKDGKLTRGHRFPCRRGNALPPHASLPAAVRLNDLSSDPA